MKPLNYLEPDIFNSVVEHTPLIAIDIVVTNKNRVLVGKRVNKPAMGNFFVPGGRICKGERFDEAFERISKGELGITLSRDKCDFLGIYDHMYEDSANDDNISTHYVVSAFTVELDLGDLDAEKLQSQHSKVAILSFDEALASPEVHENTKVYIRKLQE